MHSWVFRHRARLRAIYGPRPLPPAPVQAGLEPDEDPLEGLGSRPVPAWAGSVERGESFVLLHPMPRAKSG